MSADKWAILLSNPAAAPGATWRILSIISSSAALIPLCCLACLSPVPLPSCCFCVCRYQDRGLPFCYVGYFDGMEEGVLRANIIEAKVNNVSVRCAASGVEALVKMCCVSTQP
mgnify:CR=1 FL=1